MASLVLVLLVAALAAGVYFYARYRFDQIKKIHAQHLVAQAPAGQPFNVLLVGSDSRTFVKNQSQVDQFGTPTTQGGQRSDVTMVARIIPATKQVWIISIPRDLWVNIPGGVTGVRGMNRINAAFNTGPDLLIQTIEDDLHIPINHYMEVTFQGFQSMVTSLGGIDMDFPMPLKDAYSQLNVTQTGCQVVNGATAMALVRSRHLYYEQTGAWQYDGLSDFSRIQRQDAFFRALLTKLSAEKLSPLTLNGFIGAAVQYFTIDDTFTEGGLLSLAEQFSGMPIANLHTQTLPTVGYVTTGGADVLKEVEPDDQQMISAFLAEGATASSSSTSSSGPSTSAGASHSSGSTTSTTAAPVPASAVHVQVLNAVDFTEPIASDTASELANLGFVVTGAANATSQGLTTTEIQYAPGSDAAAQTLASHLSGATNLVVDGALTGDDVVLTVGSSLSAVTSTSSNSSAGSASADAGSNVAASTEAATTVTPSDVYTNNQQEPWNPVPCTL